MGKPLIAIDIDDVLIATTELLAQALGQRYGMRIEPYYTERKGLREHVTEVSGRPFDFVARDVHQYLLSSEFEQAAPMPGSQDALRELAKAHRLTATTVRAKNFHASTRRWIEHYFGDVIEKVYFANEYEFEASHAYRRIDKTSQLVAMRAAWLIDDKLEHLTPLAPLKTNGLLFGNYPWNSVRDMPPFVRRAANWREVVTVIDSEAA